MSAKERARELLEGDVDAVLACEEVEGSHVPRLFDSSTVEAMSEESPAGERYPVASIVRKLVALEPELRIAVVARGCDERAMIELAKQGQVDMDRITLIGLACDEETARECGCSRPYPTSIDEGSKVEGALDLGKVERLEAMPAEERLAYWLSQFNSCLKCFGCRNICPMCYCNECSLDKADLVTHGELPPTGPTFHLIRALDMAGRCIDCGLCEEACPVGIPLRTLYRKVGEDVAGRFGYRPGLDAGERSPLAVLGTEKDLEDA